LYRNGDVLSQDALKRLYRQASMLGRRRAADLVTGHQNGAQQPSLLRRLFKRK
jgi:hypothetical protein